MKVNVAEVLRRELAKPTWRREAVALGTNTDPYQRAEGRYRLMPEIIGALAESRTPFSVLTKGTLLRRDLPLLQEAAASVDVSLAMSIAVFDDTLQKLVEPGTPSAAARLETVRAATAAGFSVTVFLMPILPHLTDSIAALDHALSRIADAGATRGRVRRSASAPRRQAVVPAVARAGASRTGVELPRTVPRRHGDRAEGVPGVVGDAGAAALRVYGLDGGAEDDAAPRAHAPGPAARASVVTTAKGRRAGVAFAADPGRLF